MAHLSAKLRSFAYDLAQTRTGVAFFCPGCDGAHAIVTSDPSGKRPLWTWDGNVDAPTFSPSILTNHGKLGPNRHVCHSFVRSGVIEFLGDCTHALAGQKVPLPDWPGADHDEGEFYLKPPHDDVKL